MPRTPEHLIGVEADMEFGGFGPLPDFEILMCSPRIAHWEYLTDTTPEGADWWGAKIWLKAGDQAALTTSNLAGRTEASSDLAS